MTYLGDCPTCEIEIANPTPSVIGGIDVETRGLRSFEQTWQNLGTLVEGAPAVCRDRAILQRPVAARSRLD